MAKLLASPWLGVSLPLNQRSARVANRTAPSPRRPPTAILRPTLVPQIERYDRSGSPVPRLCSLELFAHGPLPVQPTVQDYSNSLLALPAPRTPDGRHLVLLLAADAQARLAIKTFESIAGRAAMLGFTAALVMEMLTGDGVFSEVNWQLLTFIALLPVVVGGSASFLNFALQLREDLGSAAQLTGMRAVKLLDTVLDQVFDGLFNMD
eukprot:jgi/Chlat1/7038/Chrsp56S06666